MRISDYLRPELVHVGMAPAPKETFLRSLLSSIHDTGIALPVDGALQRLMEREREASTGLGHGVAIPHTVVEDLSGTVVSVATVPQGTDFDSLDGSPTRVVFLILNPARKMGDHIRLLARLAVLAHRLEIIDEIAKASSREEVLEAIRRDDDRHLAGAV